MDHSSLLVNDSLLPADDGNSTFIINASSSLLFRFTIITLASIVILFTIFGNLLVIVAVINERQIRKVGNAYIVSLAVSDVLVGTLVSPLALMYELDGQWTLGKHVCDLWVALDVVCCTASIVNLCVISFDRYNAITQPLKYALRRTPKRAALSIICVWTYSAIIAFPPFAGWNENTTFSEPQNVTSQDECHVYQGMGYTLFSTIGAFYLPLVVMMSLYCKVFSATKTRNKQWITAPGYRKTVLSHRSSFVQKRPLAIDDTMKVIESPDKVYMYQINPVVGSRLCTNDDIRVYRRSGSLHILINKKCDDNNEDVVPALPHRLSTVSSRRSMLSRMVSLQSSSGATTDTTISTGTGEVTIENPERLLSVDFKPPPLESRLLKPVDTSAIIALCRSLSPLFGGKTDDSTDENETTEALAQNNVNVAAVPSVSSKQSKMKRKNKISLAQEKRAARTLGIIMGCFVLCWMPFFVVTLLNAFTKGIVPFIVTQVVLWLGYLNSALNPAIYTFFNRDFRRGFRSLICCSKLNRS